MDIFPFKSMLFLAIPILIQVTVIVGVVFLLKYVIQKNNNNADGFHSNRGAMRILDERFAKGEIDDAEYFRKKDILKKK